MHDLSSGSCHMTRGTLPVGQPVALLGLIQMSELEPDLAAVQVSQVGLELAARVHSPRQRQ